MTALLRVHSNRPQMFLFHVVYEVIRFHVVRYPGKNGNYKTKVIVADDEEVIANTLVVILKQAGFDARAVYSGEMAVETAQSFQPDVLISDVFMTGITGIEAAIQVRSMLPSCQILLFSGQPTAADLARRVRCFAQAYRSRRFARRDCATGRTSILTSRDKTTAKTESE